jgi:hypothetical protein
MPLTAPLLHRLPIELSASGLGLSGREFREIRPGRYLVRDLRVSSDSGRLLAHSACIELCSRAEDLIGRGAVTVVHDGLEFSAQAFSLQAPFDVVRFQDVALNYEKPRLRLRADDAELSLAPLGRGQAGPTHISLIGSVRGKVALIWRDQVRRCDYSAHRLDIEKTHETLEIQVRGCEASSARFRSGDGHISLVSLAGVLRLDPKELSYRGLLEGIAKLETSSASSPDARSCLNLTSARGFRLLARQGEPCWWSGEGDAHTCDRMIIDPEDPCAPSFTLDAPGFCTNTSEVTLPQP